MLAKTNRSFGLVIGAAFAVLASVRYWNTGQGYLTLLAVAAAFLVVALLIPRVLAPLNRIWLKLGRLLGVVVSPIILALIYVFSIVFIGVLIRLFGKDLLALERAPHAASYWIKRDPPGPNASSLTDQF